MSGSLILGLGHATPAGRVVNERIEQELDLPPGWIERRTGVRARRVCAPEESCSTLAIDAGRRALAHAGIDPAEVGLLLLATSTPDHLLPPTAPVVAAALGCSRAGAVDLAGACAGFLYALGLGEGVVRGGGGPVVVIAANVLSRRLDPRDAGGRGIFADGAGAMVLGDSSTHVDAWGQLLGAAWGADAVGADWIQVHAGGSVRPIDIDAVREGLHHLRIEKGSRVFTEAVRGMERVGHAALDKAGLSSTDVDLWVPHQANGRILERAGAALGIERERWMLILEEWGNSSAASIPTALSIAAESGRISKGQNILMTAVGAGLVEAAAVVGTGDPRSRPGSEK